MLAEYKLSAYQDYGALGNKENIHLVRNKNTGKICVKKVLGKEQESIIQFRKKNSSPYFPQVLDVIETSEEIILIEEYIEGVTLEEYMMGEPLNEQQAVNIARQICEALTCLHNAAPMIVYRDLKAENVMITSQKLVKLVDFDISRKYQEGKNRDTELLGTAEYAAPEQFGYFQTDNRTDIYAFGVLFNYMLTGKFPVECVTNGKYRELVRKCIELEPAKRYQNAEKIMEDLPAGYGMFEKLYAKHEKGEESLEEKQVSWLPPGFRSGTFWKILVAIFGYIFILYIGFTIEFTDGKNNVLPLGQLWLNRGCFTLALITTVLFNFNYGGCLEQIPIVRKLTPILRVMMFGVTALIFIAFAVILASMLEGILGMQSVCWQHTK